MPIELIGWDIGGAHLKAAAVDAAGQLVAVAQAACPLWLGLDRLHSALDYIEEQLAPPPCCRHAVTMTGELVDAFAGREEGVAALVNVMAGHYGAESVALFAGHAGFLRPGQAGPTGALQIASANWLASGLWAAANLDEALFIDIGSTTTDLLLIRQRRVEHRGYTDYERMRYDELLYTGVVRTPVMALAERAPFEGEWVNLMAEHFATTADVYRLTGELPEAADQMPAADQGEKTPAGSRRRLARLFGRDAESASPEQWRLAAEYFKERQLAKIHAGAELQRSRGLLTATAPLVGAGVGRFLVRELAQRLQHPYLDFSDLFSVSTTRTEFQAADCAPAAAVACLALRNMGPQ
jgi:probable H4MPT-linked C1 transfer pathway protein